jgi:hypothetical protein
MCFVTIMLIVIVRRVTITILTRTIPHNYNNVCYQYTDNITITVTVTVTTTTINIVSIMNLTI